jgi:DNA polymerase-3 subunit delta'
LCRSCRAVDRGGHPDVEVFSLETQATLTDRPGRGANVSIETVRRLRASAALFPLQSQRRLLLVEDAETLLEPAQQALLKVLEEPPPAVTIVLLADEPERLLPTVRSRCQEVAVRPVSEDAVSRALISRGVDHRLAEEIAAMSMGRPGWAIAAAADPKALEARRQEWRTAEAWLASPAYERLVTAFKFGEQFTKRRAVVIGTVQAAVAILRREMLAAAATEEGALDADQRTASEALHGLRRAVVASMQCLSDLESNVRPRLALEAMVLAWPSPASQAN